MRGWQAVGYWVWGGGALLLAAVFAWAYGAYRRGAKQPTHAQAPKL